VDVNEQAKWVQVLFGNRAVRKLLRVRGSLWRRRAAPSASAVGTQRKAGL